MTVDYRTLNSKTIPDRFPLLQINEFLDSLGLSAVFTKLDLDSRYHLVSLDPEDAQERAFLSKWGLYEYTILLLGLTNAPAIFQCLINLILRLWLDKGIAVYLEDIVIYSKNMEEHVCLLELILARLVEYRLFIKQSKCKFGVPTKDFFGYIISSQSVQPDPSKVQSIILWPIPIQYMIYRYYLVWQGIIIALYQIYR